MRLSPRIHALAETISAGQTAADIGTDHGYVPMLLVRNHISPSVILCDISEGSLAKAKETFRLAGIPAEEGQFRIGDGLSPLKPGEVDAVIIAGLGGLTIRGILDADEELTRSFSRLILQPRKHSGALREYLWQAGWEIVKETLTTEGKFICEILEAVPGGPKGRPLPYPSGDIRWAYPETFRCCDPALLRKRLDWKLPEILREIDSLKRSTQDRSGRILELESDYRYLQSLLHQPEQEEIR